MKFNIFKRIKPIEYHSLKIAYKVTEKCLLTEQEDNKKLQERIKKLEDFRDRAIKLVALAEKQIIQEIESSKGKSDWGTRFCIRRVAALRYMLSFYGERV